MKTVLVHDYLTQYGGAERVLDVLHEMYPSSRVLTSLVDVSQLPPAYRDWEIRESPLRLIPGARQYHRLWTPLYPAVFGHLGFWDIPADTDLIIADSSAWSHHARPRREIPMLCYCHSPARFLYGDADYLGATRMPHLLRPAADAVFGGLRQLDRRAARKVTRYVANSAMVQRRIAQQWGLEATVIHPPVDVDRFRPTAPVTPEAWFLVVSRLVPHKWIDRAVRAASAAGVPLKVIGNGRDRARLEAMAGPMVEFLGERSDDEVVWHMQRCKALILPGVEDFGMTSPEAQAAGRPVIAARGGGALETVIDGETGWLFDPLDDGALAALLCRDDVWQSERIQRNAARFNRATFEAKFRAVAEETVAGL